MHLIHVIHRDLKLENLFSLEKMEIEVGDFGLSTKLKYEVKRKRTIYGVLITLLLRYMTIKMVTQN